MSIEQQRRVGVAGQPREAPPVTKVGDLSAEAVGGGRTSAVRVTFWGIVLTGLLLRVGVATYSLGFVHPDEHQQYLEAAQGIVYGYSISFWEYDRGMRHYLYPGSLACLLCAFDAIGLTDPVSQAMMIRGLIGAAVLASIAVVAHAWLREGRIPAGLCLIALVAFSPDMIFIGARTLSETAMIVPLVLGYYFWKRDPLICGLLFGVMFAVRFQSAFMTAAFFAVAVLDDLIYRRGWLRGSAMRIAVGLVVSLLWVGTIDKLTWGGWFHSPIEYFRANVVEGKAAGFGVQPWYKYFEWAGYTWLEAAPLAVLLLVFGAIRQWRLAFVALVFLVAHMLVGHKEARFLWPALPLALILVAAGFEAVYVWLGDGKVRRVGVALLGSALLAGAWMRCGDIDWALEPSRGNSLALAKVRRLPDVTGVAVCGTGRAHGGNYFYLRRNVPLSFRWRARMDADGGLSKWVSEETNYLVVLSERCGKPTDEQLEKIDAVDGWDIYRINR